MKVTAEAHLLNLELPGTKLLGRADEGLMVRIAEVCACSLLWKPVSGVKNSVSNIGDFSREVSFIQRMSSSCAKGASYLLGTPPADSCNASARIGVTLREGLRSRRLGLSAGRKDSQKCDGEDFARRTRSTAPPLQPKNAGRAVFPGLS